MRWLENSSHAKAEPQQGLRESLGILEGAVQGPLDALSSPSAEDGFHPSSPPFSSWNSLCHVLPRGLCARSVLGLSVLLSGLHSCCFLRSITPSKLASGPTSICPFPCPPSCLLKALPQESHCLWGSFLSPSRWKSLCILSVHECLVLSISARFTNAC